MTRLVVAVLPEAEQFAPDRTMAERRPLNQEANDSCCSLRFLDLSELIAWLRVTLNNQATQFSGGGEHAASLTNDSCTQSSGFSDHWAA